MLSRQSTAETDGSGFVTTTYLLNDFWRIDLTAAPPGSLAAGVRTAPIMARICKCGQTLAAAAGIDRPDVLGVSEGASGRIEYPGPRYAAATWSISTNVAWVFGGVGRSVSKFGYGGGTSTGSADCTAAETVSGWVGNLCDTWRFVDTTRAGPLVGSNAGGESQVKAGWTLVAACSRDVPALDGVGLKAQPLPGATLPPVGVLAVPTAAVYAAKWFDERAGALLLYGGVADCGSWDGHGPDGKVVPLWQRWRDDPAAVTATEHAALSRGP